MITIHVTSYNGLPPPQPLSTEFDETGGSIGRAAINQLVLPDPERLISKVHAKIAFREGGYVIIDQGGNPAHLNDRPIGKGNAARLADGDELRIGGYTLRVSLGAAEKPIGPAAGAPAAGQPVDDPLALFGGSSPAGDPFGGLITPAPSRPPAAPAKARPAAMSDPFRNAPAQPAAGAPKPAGGVIPDDFDPFADPFAAKPAVADTPAGASLPDDFDLGLTSGPASARSIDALFGLDDASKRDPFAGTPLGEPSPGGVSSPERNTPASDHVPELYASFVPPRALPDDANSAKPPLARNREGEPAKAAGGELFLSWESENRPGETAVSKTLIQPRQSAPPSADPLAAMFGNGSAAPAAAPDPLGLVRSNVATDNDSRGVASSSVPAPQPDRPAGEQALLQAFLAGLGTPDLALPQGLTPELMQRVGRLMREATQGTLDLLLARAMTKREVRAQVTMIVGRDNNPLKFSPEVAVALAHLLAPQGRGFMPPLEAMRDAYDDLRAHQFGFMAGMRAALAAVLQRFDPQHLEQRLKQKSMLDNLVPMSRKARMWELFAELYEQISQEAEEDFHTLFGKEFLRAYEEQVARLDERDKGRK